MPRAWVIHEYKGLDALSLEEVEQQEPGPGEVRLRVEAFALNWGDMNLMNDLYSFSFSALPAPIGMEAAGIVDAIGEGVTGIEIGERHCTLPHFYDRRGASSESVVIDARYVTQAPAGMSAVESASVWMQYMTAYFPVVELSGDAPKKAILATAATGTAGTAALQIGRIIGATMIGTTRFAYNRDYLEEAGADHVYVDGDGDLAELLREATGGRGINAAFDAVGGGMIKRYSKVLAKNARIFFYGKLDSELPELPMRDIFQANAVFQPYSLFNYVEDAAMCAKGKAFVYDALAAGHIGPRIDRVYPMEGYREAWDYVKETRRTHGKVVIETGLS